MRDERVNIIGVNISATNMNAATDYTMDHFDQARGNYICVANVHTTVMAHEDQQYRKIQNESFLTLPDGKPLSVIGKKRGFSAMDRVTGPEYMEKMIELSRQNGLKHYFYGNTQQNLQKLIDYLQEKYPELPVAGYQPSAFRELTEQEMTDLAAEIDASGADFVWVGLGAPRQEVFCRNMIGRTNALMVGVGGAFNVICGIIPRAPQWMQDHSLEWLFRLLQEPRRLFKRYFVTNSKFLFYLLTHKTKS